jgi:GH24 family phage-related lysozyme (muramidase)
MNTIKITDELKARIRDHEGCRDTVYLDSLGKATIGIGHLVQPHERDRYKEGVVISADDIEDLFLIDLNRACAGAEQLISENYRSDRRLPQEIEHVIVEMVFQLGKTGVSKFRKMWKALSEGNRKQASLEMKDSRWYSQTPVRCEALAEIVENA